MKKIRIPFLMAIAIIICFFPLKAAIKIDELKAGILTKVIRFVKWSPESIDGSNEIVFGIIGKSPIIEYLNDMCKKIKLKNKNIQLKKLTGLEGIENCHILFVGKIKKKLLKEILAITKDKPILTMANSTKYCKKGVLLNLYSDGNKIKFEINRKAVDNTGLKFSSKLYKLAKIIE